MPPHPRSASFLDETLIIELAALSGTTSIASIVTTYIATVHHSCTVYFSSVEGSLWFVQEYTAACGPQTISFPLMAY